MGIAERIRRRRAELGVSLQKVAAAIGVTKNAVHLWETGDVTKMKLDNRIALSEFLDIPLVDLLPPKAAGKDMTIRDPEEILVIERLRKAKKQQRELFVRLVVEMTEDPSQTG